MRLQRRTRLTKNDIKKINLSLWIEKYGYLILQYAIATIFFWFGVLKVLGDAPVDLLLEILSEFIPLELAMKSIGVIEIMISISMFRAEWVEYSLKLFAVYMPITLLPFILAPNICFSDFPFVFSLQGEAIISHLALISGAIVIGGRRHIKIIEVKV